MKIKKYRFFLKDDGSYMAEEITWALVSTNGIDRNDPRAAPIGQPENIGNEVVDLWVPVLIIKPGFDVSAIDHLYNMAPRYMQNEVGQMIETDVKSSVSTFTQMNVYSQPLLPGLTEITMQQYNDGIAIYAANLPIGFG